jgi:hypothetical protein
MGIANTSGGMGNVLRLQGLKNVSGRRVMPGDEMIEEQNEPNFDVQGTAPKMPNFANFIPQNEPQPELGGELTSQSYDVRSNLALPEENIEQENEELDPHARMGRALVQMMRDRYKSNPENPENVEQQLPIETQQVDLQEGMMPPRDMEQIEQPQINPEQKELQNLQEAEDSGEIKEPGTYVQIGATKQLYDDLSTDPALKSEIERIFDVNLSPERLEEVNALEAATNAYIEKLNGVEVALGKREQELLSKIENRNLSTSEQISMAIALMAPAIIAGAIAGKEGFAGALAHSGKGVSEMLSRKEKEQNEAQEMLPEIALERAKISKEKLSAGQQTAEMKRKIQENVPNHALKKLFQRDGMLYNGKLVLNTGNPLLPLKSSAIRTEKDYDNFREKVMPKLSEKISVTEQGLHLLDNLAEMVEISEKGKEGFARDYIPFYDLGTKAYKALIPAGRDTFKDENGNEVKISELYDTTIEQLSDMYSQALGGGGTKGAFKTYREHFKEMIPNPYTLSSFRKGQTKEGTVKSQINSVKNKFEENIIKTLEHSGVDTGPIKETFSKTGINTNQTEANRKKQRTAEAVNQFTGK